MIRKAAICLVFLLASSLTAPAIGTADQAATSAAKCTWKWKKKRIVKYVKRHGKKKRVVRYRRYRVCVPVSPPAPARLGVKAYEYGFTLSRTSLNAGDTIVELSNRGEDEHNLHLQRIGGGSETVIPDTAPLTYERARFETEPGTYRLWCSLPSHAELGMDTTVPVTAE